MGIVALGWRRWVRSALLVRVPCPSWAMTIARVRVKVDGGAIGGTAGQLR